MFFNLTGNNKCAFTETAMECVGNGKGGGGGSAGNSYVGSTVVRGNAYAPPPKITRASPNVKFEVSWNEAKSFNKLNIEKAFKPKGTGKSSSGSSLDIRHSSNPKVKFSDSELRAANYMYEQGHQVVLRHPVGTRADGGTSDLLVNGVRYDVYTPTTSNPNRIISSMAGKN